MPTQTHPLSPAGPMLVVARNPRGSVLIDTTSAGSPRVEISARVDGDLDGVEVRADDGRVEVEVEGRRFGRQPKLHVVVHVPAGSTADIQTASATVETRGELAGCEVQSASGAVQLDRIAGNARVALASGTTKVESVDGDLDVRTSSGAIRVGHVGGDSNLSSASGSVELGHGGHDVRAKTASGAIRLRNVESGKVEVKATSGSIRIGVQRGTLVWLDASATSGSVRSDLDDEPRPGDGDGEGPTLEIRAHTTSGSVRIERSATAVV